jgi:hypothetical protein
MLDRTRELVHAADEGGLQLVGIQDHPYQARFIDTFLTGFVDHGFDTLVFWPVDPAPGQVEILASEVVPLLSGADTDRGRLA